MSKPARMAALRAPARNRRRPRSMSARVISRGTWLCGKVGQRRRRDDRPAALRKRLVDALPHQLGRALAPGMAELQAELRRRIGVHEIDDALPRRFLRVGIEPGAAGRDARVRRHAGHLGEDQAGAADGARAVMHEVPVVRQAVDARSTGTSARPRRGWRTSCRAAGTAGTSAARAFRRRRRSPAGASLPRRPRSTAATNSGARSARLS